MSIAPDCFRAATDRRACRTSSYQTCAAYTRSRHYLCHRVIVAALVKSRNPGHRRSEDIAVASTTDSQHVLSDVTALRFGFDPAERG